jgi:hypothetical protein
MRFDGDRLGFRREFGVLLEDGSESQDWDELMRWGLRPERLQSKDTKCGPHPNNFVMSRRVFELLGGYDEQRITTMEYPQREDNDFKRKLRIAIANGLVQEPPVDDRATLLMFPNGQWCGDVDSDPLKMFHTLTRKTPRNYWHNNPRYPQNAT